MSVPDVALLPHVIVSPSRRQCCGWAWERWTTAGNSPAGAPVCTNWPRTGVFAGQPVCGRCAQGQRWGHRGMPRRCRCARRGKDGVTQLTSFRRMEWRLTAQFRLPRRNSSGRRSWSPPRCLPFNVQRSTRDGETKPPAERVVAAQRADRMKFNIGGAEGVRTPDPHTASMILVQPISPMWRLAYLQVRRNL
jgi:hypothetical protein